VNVPPIFEQQKQPSDRDYVHYLSQVLIRMWGQLARVVNHGIELYTTQPSGQVTAGNVKGTIFRGSLAAGANTVFHDLGKLPIGFVVLSLDTNTTLWYGGGTTAQATINAGAACNATVLII
jgi:hypothetical protein